MGGFAGLSGFSGVGGAGAMRALVAQRAMGMMAGGGGGDPLAMLSSMGLGGAGQFTSTQQTQVHADPAGGSSVGFLTLWNSPRLDTEVAYATTGKRAAVLFSGNSYFQPFVWDAIHLFEVDYDSEGRVVTAWEMDKIGAPRLDFTWDGPLLKQIAARPVGGAAAVYTRNMQYNGDKLIGETITFNGKVSKIQYKYDKQGRLIEAECEDDLSLDGRSREIEFVAAGVRK
jgi:YD repeat-containing protein